MSTPFNKRQLKNSSFFQRILGKKPKENVIIEIMNLLADKFPNITSNNIDEIAFKYKTNIHKIFMKELYDIYRTYLKYCLMEKHLSKEEINNLNHLKNLLGLSDNKIKEGSSGLWIVEIF